jgi:putative transposase
MYRLLKRRGESRERRDQLTHPPYQKPELLATAPNQLWSWDITKLLGPAKWTYSYLYVILDVFSRYVTGWMVAMRESAELVGGDLVDLVADTRGAFAYVADVSGHGIPAGVLMGMVKSSVRQGC